ncbi:hypothetical protein CKO44_20640 [Rubrivivax gelatinosus]|uniref:ElaB/YqjD/DUF883 family membrane-anchored ribosome-binding protein n=1 Tax=Rubrivivax gelatinosus TaxID=28068 RepID=A0ABS1DVX9_RUBGE|nr:hypothetical protein [Rubrivivax gelatinosus]MBK1615865.1 hypothetical protein [Rubrivivax gelatinosus]MBK1714186.1 hypothetical protein [Rubrivivax gelatinosus]
MNQDNTSRAHAAIDELSARTDAAWADGRRFVDQARQSLHDGLDETRERTPELLGRAKAQVEDFARRRLDGARAIGADVRHRVDVAGERTAGYIKDEPLKSVLVAAAAGAVVALLIGAFASRSRRNRRS